MTNEEIAAEMNRLAVAINENPTPEMNEEFSRLHDELLSRGVNQEWIVDNVVCPEV
jgi:hypothetical protein